MKTKTGKVVPLELAARLRAQPELLEMWGRLRPSCQQRYVNLVQKAKKTQTKMRRVDMVVRMTSEWHKRYLERVSRKTEKQSAGG